MEHLWSLSFDLFTIVPHMTLVLGKITYFLLCVPVTILLILLSVLNNCCYCFQYLLIEKSWLIGKDTDAGEDWRQEEKRKAEDEMVGWHHWLNGHEFEQALEDSEEQGSLGCCSPWGHKQSETTEWLNNNKDFHGYLVSPFI